VFQQAARGSQHLPAQAPVVIPRENRNGAHLTQVQGPERQPWEAPFHHLLIIIMSLPSRSGREACSREAGWSGRS
jgi:hypothetical protein